MLHGPLTVKILVFALPLIASGILQQSFNAVDVAVIGRYSSSNAIAAVGSNGPLVSILVNMFLGIAIGANVVIANYLGQRNNEGVRRSVSTVMIIAFASGLILLLCGVFLARPILQAMSTPPEVIDLATTYLRIFFCGMPFMMVYNFGSAIMRSIGDTRKPFYALLVSSLVNLFLDLLFVAVFDWGVAGVAWATVIANGVNAGIMVWFLIREDEPVTLSFGRLKLSVPDFKKMLQIGIPAGLQGMVFSISNVFIQSSINSYGPDAIAGSAAALTFEYYCYYIIASFAAAAIAFVGQNYGAGEYKRCRRVWGICMLYGLVVCGIANVLISIFSDSCLSIITDNPAVVLYAEQRFHYVLICQFVAATYEVSGSYMRGLGYSMTPMLLTIFGTCVLRLVWVSIYRELDNSFAMLLSIYPITWVITGIAVVVAAIVVGRRVERYGMKR